ncbi:MAG TPA: hypothetical protein VMB81_23485, partial [Candidatus Sulfotelmatobacter sp.]|nr:hypothetical protein [Candidatus Sulfotelmatobacter sp.]
MKRSADTRLTRPSRAWITPSFDTPGATSATRPPSATVMVPRLTTPAVGALEGSAKFNRPAMKSPSL